MEQKEYLDEIAQWLKSVKFRRKAFGGVDETDVWKKIDELNRMYEKVFLMMQGGEQKEPDADE